MLFAGFNKKILRDIALAVSICLLAFIALIIVNVTQSEGSKVIVISNDTVISELDMNSDITFTVEGDNGGYNVVSINNRSVKVGEASCPDKICVKHKAINNVGESIVCLPNKLIVIIEE